MVLSACFQCVYCAAMQRPIPATRSLPFREAHTALPGVQKNLMHRGFTRKPYDMCAEVDRYGLGWAVYVGFQDSVDLSSALLALEEAAKRPGNTFLTWQLSAMTHSM